MTLLVALALPTAVKFWPVVASRVISGKKRLTTLSGTTTERESKEPEALVGAALCDGDCAYTFRERIPIKAIASDVAGLNSNRLCVLPMRPLICNRHIPAFGRTSIRFIPGI